MRSAGVGGVFVCVMDAGCQECWCRRGVCVCVMDAGCEECWCRRGVCVCDGCWMSGVLV